MRQDWRMARKNGGVESEIDRLFTLDPSQFIAARDELANRLKGGGRADEARQVRGLRRPTVAAWAANQVARRHPSDIEELLSVGAELRSAQRKVLSGVRTGGFREAMDRRRKVVTKLTRAAEEVLRESGHGSAGATEAVSATFEAASLDEDAAEQLRAGRLSKELPAPAGFGGVEGLELVPSPPEARRPKAARPTKEEEAAARKAAEREARQLAQEAAQARRRAIKARADADRARQRAEELEQKVEDARTQAREIEKEARQAESEAKRAEAAATRASG
jgi:hypothetical protein